MVTRWHLSEFRLNGSINPSSRQRISPNWCWLFTCTIFFSKFQSITHSLYHLRVLRPYRSIGPVIFWQTALDSLRLAIRCSMVQLRDFSYFSLQQWYRPFRLIGLDAVTKRPRQTLNKNSFRIPSCLICRYLENTLTRMSIHHLGKIFFGLVTYVGLQNDEEKQEKWTDR